MKIPYALSVRQPWAWLIVSGPKDVENRSWLTAVRGPILIHASAGLYQDEYDAASHVIRHHGLSVVLPPLRDLQRGGLVGIVELVDCVERHPSVWFSGPRGFVLGRRMALPFVPCRGRLGFFNVGALRLPRAYADVINQRSRKS